MSEALARLDWDTADRLRKALRFADVSVGEMADELRVSRQTIGRYINGHVVPDYRTMRLWALRTGVPLDWLLGDEDVTARSDHQRSRYEPESAPPVDPFDPETGQTQAVAALQKRLRARIPVDAAMSGR